MPKLRQDGVALPHAGSKSRTGLSHWSKPHHATHPPQQIDQIDHFDCESTGVAHCWNADVVATAKRDLVPGEVLDGEGGYTVWGKLLPAKRSVAIGGLPLGLAHGVKLLRPVAQGQALSMDDVAMDTGINAFSTRRAMEEMFEAGE